MIVPRQQVSQSAGRKQILTMGSAAPSRKISNFFRKVVKNLMAQKLNTNSKLIIINSPHAEETGWHTESHLRRSERQNKVPHREWGNDDENILVLLVSIESYLEIRDVLRTVR